LDGLTQLDRLSSYFKEKNSLGSSKGIMRNSNRHQQPFDMVSDDDLLASNFDSRITANNNELLLDDQSLEKDGYRLSLL
jgi:hypothetical protein